MSRIRKYSLLIMVLCGTVIGFGLMLRDAYVSGYLARELSAVNVSVAEAAEMPAMQSKLEAKKWELVDELAKCECGSHTWAEGYFRLDTNNKHSWGCLQFQEDTVKHYVALLSGRVIETWEAKVIALTREDARQLAYDIIWTTDAGVAKDWVNCSAWHGLQSRVDLIKSLEQQ